MSNDFQALDQYLPSDAILPEAAMNQLILLDISDQKSFKTSINNSLLPLLELALTVS